MSTLEVILKVIWFQDALLAQFLSLFTNHHLEDKSGEIVNIRRLF